MSVKRHSYEMINVFERGKKNRRSLIDLLQERGPEAKVVLITEDGIKTPPIALGDIPLVNYTLKCGYQSKGIAVEKRNLIFCPNHNVEEPVVRIN